MSAKRPAGTPEEEPRPAGSPEAPVGPAGASQQQPPAPEDTAPEPEASAEQQRLEQDLDELQETKRERDEYLELAKRTRADFENYRKRVSREAEEAVKRGKADLASELLPVLDNLEQALSTSGIDPDAVLAGEASVDGALEQGLVLTYRELHGTLTRAGIEPYDPAGERFDPTWHEALQTRSEDGTESGVVLEVLQKGYRLDGRVIRAARVVVSA
jgi:molecular chaperone GrpE